jgi:iron complex transport system permease protein
MMASALVPRSEASMSSRALLLCIGFALLLVLLTGLSAFWGAADLSPASVWQTLFESGANEASTIVWQLRLPRAVLAIVVGMHFAISGMILQSALRNPLADPGVLGISSGATLAVVLFLLFDVFLGASDNTKLDAYPIEYLPIVAQFGGIGTVALVYGLSWRGGAAPARLILFGIAIGATLQALAMGILAGWGSVRIEVVLNWLSGSLYGKDWHHLYPLLPWTVLGLLVLPWVMRPMRVLALGDDAARSLGLSAQGWRLALVALAGSLAAAAVAVVGPIGFLGLLVPHTAQRLVGGSPSRCVPLVMLLGADLALGADLLGRMLIVPDEVPIGAITALLGAPFFLYLMSQRRSV